MAELIAGPWDNIFRRDIRAATGEICLLVPFVSGRGIEFLLKYLPNSTKVRMITRLNDEDFLSGVSDIDALIELVDNGVRMRVQNRRLHAKVYLFGDHSVIVTSGNLTRAGIKNNAEVGVRLSNTNEVKSGMAHFERVWKSLKADVSKSKLSEVQAHVAKLQLARKGHEKHPEGIKDHGHNGFSGRKGPPQSSQKTIHRAGESAGKHYCKFLWRRDDPASIDTAIEDIAAGQGAVAFPQYPGRPNQLKLNDHIYYTALTFSEYGRDWRVFGRSRVATPHRPGKDEAPDDLKKSIPVIAKYPYCIWLCDCEFIDGTIGDGVSLHELFDRHGDGTFEWSQRKAEEGDRNRHTEAIRYYRSHIALTTAAADSLNSAIDAKISKCGKIFIRSGENIWWNHWIKDFDKKRLFKKQI